jgi:hypothetical protein
MVMSATSRSDVSLIAIVPDSECRIPTLIVSPVAAAGAAGAAADALADAVDVDAAGAGAAASSLLQPSDASRQQAPSAMSHFRMTWVTPR